MSEKPKLQAGYLDGRWVSFYGFQKNTLGHDNIEYAGVGIVGVCVPSYWTKHLKKEKQERTRQAGWV